MFLLIAETRGSRSIEISARRIRARSPYCAMKDRFISQRKGHMMTIIPMMHGGALALVLATPMLVQGCASSNVPPQQALLTDTGPTTGPYSGQAWYTDLYYTMTSESGGE
jgi:hypothetical protein